MITEKAMKFLESEYGLKEEQLRKMDVNEWHYLRMKCFDVERSEIGEDGKASEKGEAAANIVSLNYQYIQGKSAPTTMITVHHSSTGYHVVPSKPRGLK